MAKVSLPKLGEIEGSQAFVVLVLAMIIGSALVGLTIWTGDDSSNETPTSVAPPTTAPTSVAPPATVDDFDDFEFDGPFDYGDDPYLDSLFDGCRAGFAPDCDDLYWESPVDSEYEWFGATCGGIFEWLGGGC